jgi:hypothetical protein
VKEKTQHQALGAPAANAQAKQKADDAWWAELYAAGAPTPGRYDGVPGLDYDIAHRMALIMVQVNGESRTIDEIDQDIQQRCWAFSLNHHERKDAEGNVFADCGRSASDCFRSHADVEIIQEEALERMEKLRIAQLEKQKKGSRTKANKPKGDGKGKVDARVFDAWKGSAKGGAKGAGKGVERGWGRPQQPQDQYGGGAAPRKGGWCSKCEIQGHRNIDCIHGGADIDWQAEARQKREVNAIGAAAAAAAIRNHMTNLGR